MSTTQSTEEVRRRIAQVGSWWHRIEIQGVETPGIKTREAHRWVADAIDRDLTGKSVLDIGAWDGYFSFLAERRGAKRVLAIDSNQDHSRPDGFFTAKELLGSRVEHRTMSVYELDRLDERFDWIFFLGVYYHLDDPYLALQKIFERLNPGGVLLMEGLVRSGSAPVLHAYDPSGSGPTAHCAATVPWLLSALGRIGYRDARFLSRYAGDGWLDRPVRALAWHLRLHAGKLRNAHRALLRAERP